MARTTNSDTLPFVDSRYELGMLAAQRVRDLNGGAEPLVETGNDKKTVIALREIASGKLDIDTVRHEFVQSYKNSPVVTTDEESLDVHAEEPSLHEIDAELEQELLGGDAGMITAEEMAETESGDDDSSDGE